ncbi:uncharacterized protein LOC106643429 [Copidosoma floridanum]|uniref:uncharacterized protein LOC106643429 n=1 Tax=Copidosoma floridanum TaxID=29053 RepID=UPI0006C9B3E5|nr:uncharacterized protein LOC106643429 [Copidosoma floridanum]
MELLPFWSQHPATWFTQAELIFASNNTTSEAPPAENRYEGLKKHVLARFSDSKDQQLHKLFFGVSLGNKKPSQLYREMKSLAGNSLTDDSLRVKWLDLLPAEVQPFLRILKSTSLDELLQAADKLVCNSSFLQTNHTFVGVSPVSSGYASPVSPHQLHNEILLQEIAVLKVMITLLSTTNKQLLELLKNNKGNGGARGWDRSRSGERNQCPGAHAWCYFHRKFGVNAYSCKKPCTFVGPQSQGQLPTRLRIHSVNPSRPPNFSQAQREALTLYPANHSPIHTYGSWKINLNLGLRRDFQWKFIITDVAPAIIGANFLAEHGLLPDLKHKRLIDPLTGLAVKGTLCDNNLHSIATIEQLGPDDPDVAIQHRIITCGQPVFERPRRLIGERLAAAKAAITELQNQGVVRPSSSQWASPLHLVPKANNSWRVTSDYHRLNSITVPYGYPLPIVENNLQESQGQVFTVIDLYKAFYQVPIASGDVKKTAVTIPFGLFEFLGTSLGLRNATQTMQRTMDQLLRKLSFVKTYIDDILVASQTHEEHLQHLRQLFTVLKQAGFKVNLAKCTFSKPQVIFWGFQVSSEGCRPPIAKVETIKVFAKPTTASELRRFLRVINCYRRCVPHTVELQAPLNELLKGLPKKPNVIDATCTTYLAADALLALRTDALSTAIGAALEQLQPDESWRPLGFFSHKQDSTQARYSTYDRELPAIYASVEHFERILDGRSFTIFTDHWPITFTAFQPATKALLRQARYLECILSRKTTPRPPEALTPAAKPIEVATTDVTPTT